MTSSDRYLCFNLGPEEFAIPLLSVREVLGLPEITPVPQTPPHFLGIMNLRGKVISIMDLRLKLGIKSAKTEETSVIILEIGEASLGVVVDQVNSVQEISAEERAEKPAMESSKSNEYVDGIYKKEDRLILLLDIAKALSIDEKKLLQNQQKLAA